MTIQEFRDYMASGKPVVGGGDLRYKIHFFQWFYLYPSFGSEILEFHWFHSGHTKF